ncbi:hypothetical protein GE061_016139 [Apolygus lucorum]|uniref:Mediator of RNA polymerase II transcription subunit 29 n=1 Tax=Apolygus lucorum TaxID=248454 RepID=A0A8S9XHC9_APOLU|nr:hypothetical protein GE061_016139 [Apolygus lucorum]
MNEKSFSNFKKQVLHYPDASKKGDIDERVQPVINKINASDRFVTLSSCSGRTAVLLQSNDITKDGCQWVYTTHDFVDDTALTESIRLSASRGDLTLKFEPFILHVACRSLEDAKLMLTCALNAGCKNSGMVVGKHGRFTVAARNTLQMEVPLASKGKVLVSEEFIMFLATQANEKMNKNFEKLCKFEKFISKLLNEREDHLWRYLPLSVKMMQMGGLGPGGPPMAPQMPPQNVVQPPMVGPPQPPPQAQEKLDNISKVKSLIGPLTTSLSTTLKTAAHNLHQNALVDIGTSKNIDILPPRFDKSLEEFYSICDQIELHLVS